MKKSILFLIIVMVFTLILCVQVITNIFEERDTILKSHLETNILPEKELGNLLLRDIDNNIIDFSQIKATIVIIKFWASWCLPCYKDFPSLVKLNNKYTSDAIFIVAISNEDDYSLKKIKSIQKKYSFNFPIILDSSKEIFQKFNITKIPTSLIFYHGKLLEISKGNKDFFSSLQLLKFDRLLGDQSYSNHDSLKK